MTNSLKGEIALVTGSGRGLGRAIVDRLAQLGASVAVHDINMTAPAEFGEARDLREVAQKLAAHGGRVAVVMGDVTDEAAVDRMVTQIETELGPVSILVNNAGGDIGIHGGKPEPNDALDIPAAEMRAMLERNLVGTMLVCKRVCRGMRDRRKGSVICIGSVAGHVGCSYGAMYAVAKAGVVHYARCLAAQLQPHGVRVNAVSPGPTLTARFEATRKTEPHMRDPNNTDMTRYTMPQEVADVVAFLAGDGARFVSGQVIRVDGAKQLTPG